MTKKIAFIIGHQIYGKDKGAVNYKGEPESIYNLRVSKKVKEKLTSKGYEVDIFIRDNTTYKKMAQRIASWGADCSIELHFNSFNKPAYGCECLALDNDSSSIKFADHITDHISKIMKIGERNKDGVLRIGKGGRGYLNLKIIKEGGLKGPVVLVEPCFANIKTEESKKFFENEDLYVDSLVSSITTYFPMKQEKPVSEKNNFLGDNQNIKDYEKSPKNLLEAILNIFNPNYK